MNKAYYSWNSQKGMYELKTPHGEVVEFNDIDVMFQYCQQEGYVMLDGMGREYKPN